MSANQLNQYWAAERPEYHLDTNNIQSPETSIRTSEELQKHNLHDNLGAIKNDTLGFEKIFVVSLPERGDRRDAFTLTSSLTGFNFEWVDGVKGADVPTKALPSTFNRELGDNVIGCWRAHMNAANAVVKQRLSTALIMEDDADWDVSLKSQLKQFALGSRFIMNTTQRSTPHSPYGDGWDLLWIGHCSSQAHPNDDRRYLIEHDRTVTPPSRRANWGPVPDMSIYDNNTRIIYRASGGVCLYAYALSFQGAQKLLYHLSVKPFSNAVDLGLLDMCNDDSRDFKCISVFPQIIGDHKAAGPTDRDSDIGQAAEGQRDNGFSWNVVYSARLNLNQLLRGQTAFERQWPEDD
ncbi:MAG: hypothetical protein M1834_008786 [Cirrosporium novae-zelandiae]|nr:MAG: hypothetical protein M1834_008786 [Cirrosporium novae-zelandiae]